MVPHLLASAPASHMPEESLPKIAVFCPKLGLGDRLSAVALIALRPEDPCLQAWGGMAVSSLLCHTACIPQGLRKSTPVERNRRPRFQRTCKPVTASSLWVACLVRRVRPRNPPASAVGRVNVDEVYNGVALLRGMS